jgi:aminopeptidase N
MFYIGKEGSFASFGLYWYPRISGYLRSTGKMHFSVPAGYTAVAPGKRISLQEEEESDNFAFSMTHPVFLSFAVGKYVVERRTDAQGHAISAYLLKPRARIGEYLDKCLKVLDALTQEFGPYPFGELAIVETPRKKSSFAGASDDGIVFGIDRFFQGDFNTAFWGHEIAHQWLGCSIRMKSMHGGLILVEGMGGYGSLLAVEILEGPGMAERFRRIGYPGYAHEQNAAGYFKLVAKGLDQPLDSSPQTRRIVDAKGFIVYDMLSRTIGREKFRRILQDIVKYHAASEISWDEFLDEIEKGSGMNLRWFYEQWFERKGAPRWELSWRQEGNVVRGTILQQQPYYRADVEVLIEGNSGQNLLKTVELRSEKTEFSFPSDFKVRNIIVDPHFLVLHHKPK